MNDTEKWPKKFSLGERSQKTFQSYLNGEFGTRFYQDHFLEGIAARRVELEAKMAKVVGSCFFATTLLAFFDLVKGSVTIFGVTIAITTDIVPILTLLAASSLLAVCFAFIDILLMQRYISSIGSNIGIYNFNLFLLDKMAINLWSDALIPTYFGEKSGSGHKVTFMVLSVFVLIAGLIGFSYPTIFIVKTVVETLASSEATFAAKLLVTLAAFVTVWVVALIVFFSLKFEFNRADFNENDLQPTEEFEAEMKKKIAGEDMAPPHSDTLPR